MKCKKCGCDALIKTDDWYKCPECGAVMFDTDVRINDVTSPTKQMEEMEEAATVNNNSSHNGKKKRKNKDNEKPKSKIRDIIDFCIPIVVAVVIAILLKSCVFANAVVPTGSMINTIQEKDRIIASRLTYKNSDPQRYDIVIFLYPDNEKQYFVKRIIGLPGETVEIVEGIVYVTQENGKTIQLDDSFVTNCVPTGNFGPYKVPEDSYFMMGDNRNTSWDSRYWKNKYVKRNKILGKVMFKYYPRIEKIE